MTTGHFGFAAVVKSSAPKVPLWALMLSTYLLDFVFIFLVAGGLKYLRPSIRRIPPTGRYRSTLITVTPWWEHF